MGSGISSISEMQNWTLLLITFGFICLQHESAYFGANDFMMGLLKKILPLKKDSIQDEIES